MGIYEVSITVVIDIESDCEPTEKEVMEFCRRDPDQLLHHLEVDFIEEKGGVV